MFKTWKLEKRQKSSYEELIEFQKHEHKDFASPISVNNKTEQNHAQQAKQHWASK